MTTLVDANILLYAYDASSPHHPAARRWPQAEISSGRPVRLALVTLLAFVRIASDIRVFAKPLSATEACNIVESCGWPHRTSRCWPPDLAPGSSSRPSVQTRKRGGPLSWMPTSLRWHGSMER